MSRVDPDVWNGFITYITGGLLYGSEVAKPAWLTPDRKIHYVPRPNARPSLRRDQVRERLLKGWTYAEIARDLNVAARAIDDYATQVYKQHRVHSRAELARLYDVQLPAKPETKQDKVRRRLLAGQSYQQIAAEMGLTRGAVRHHASNLLRRGVIPPKRDKAAAKRATVLRLLAQGLSRKQIALKLRMPYGSVQSIIERSRNGTSSPPNLFTPPPPRIASAPPRRG